MTIGISQEDNRWGYGEMYDRIICLEAAHDALSKAGHEPGCEFAACTCGATDEFKTARLEFYRQYNKIRRDK